MEHPVLMRICQEGFTPLGWFEPAPEDGVQGDAKFVILIGNAGPDLFLRFSRERDPSIGLLDEWTRDVVDALAKVLEARAVYPFDRPHLPFLTWARRGGGGHVSPLGLNIHPVYGLWHAYRAALLFPAVIDLPRRAAGIHPCESCEGRPCLGACPVHAFDGKSFDVAACGQHVLLDRAQSCDPGGCKARLACPVGKAFTYSSVQMAFHMRAFVKERAQTRLPQPAMIPSRPPR